MYTDIQEPMLNATQEQVDFGPQKTNHIATGNFIIFIFLRKDASKNVTQIYDLCQIQYVFKVIGWGLHESL